MAVHFQLLEKVVPRTPKGRRPYYDAPVYSKQMKKVVFLSIPEFHNEVKNFQTLKPGAFAVLSEAVIGPDFLRATTSSKVLTRLILTEKWLNHYFMRMVEA